MNSKFRITPRDFRIYALIDRELKVAFVGKSYAVSLASLYSLHINGKNYNTADYFGKEAPKVRPEVLILEELCCTGAEAYKHVIAWSLYLEEHGFLMLTQTGTLWYSEQLYPETKAIYERISKDTLDGVLQRTHSLRRKPSESKSSSSKPKKAPKPKLSIRVDEQDKKLFHELKRGLRITQRETFHLLLDGMVLADDGTYQPLVRRQEHRIYELEQELQTVKNELTEERMNKKHDLQKKELLVHAKTVAAKYIQQIMQGVYYLDKPLRPVRKGKNSLHDFPYPTESGHTVIQLDEMIYGSSTDLVFVLGWTEDEKPIKLRHYGLRGFLGSDPRFSDYAMRGSWWQVHYRLDKSGAVDLMAALPLPPKTQGAESAEKPATDLDKMIREIENRLE
ncbi:MAG: hypothetical protein E7475_02770 [Ruminococcaceae bacterium]|nr:hypothetical protein [Oscillospiraceae bacterium]